MVQDFFPKNQHAQKKKKSTNELRFIEKYQNRTLKVDFLCLKLSESFQIKFSLKNINLGHQLLLKPFFDKIQF